MLFRRLNSVNAQIPVLPKAVQVKVVGVADRQAELQGVLKAALMGVEGETNW